MEKSLRLFSGFTLIEVLVAFLLLTVGMLSFVAYQTKSLQHTDHAYLVSVANTQIQSLFERLKASHSTRARERELNAWNEENAALLPTGHGMYSCESSACTVQITWRERQLQTLAVSIPRASANGPTSEAS